MPSLDSDYPTLETKFNPRALNQGRAPVMLEDESMSQLGGGGIGSTLYATRRRKLMALISSLRSIGAQAELDLPRIVCIGNQSAGKSSVIESISQIRVPRDSGTCTRCPMECRLSPADSEWAARLSLRVEFDSEGKRLPETKTYSFGSTITAPNAVELGLRRAQAAILDWGFRSYDEFLTMSEEALLETGSNRKEQLAFSKNTVCLDISGPELIDLVFVDLPGLIQNAQEDMITLVEEMVMEQIKGNSIILITLPMTDELENQKAALLAKREDPEGLRTIGVLTKPDMLTSRATRSLKTWMDILEGRKHPLTHGYYCTRQPEDSDRAQGISFDEARRAETEFFENTSPWSNSFQRESFGILNLTEKLSMLLSQKIDETLPKLQLEVKSALERNNLDLAALPPPPSSDPSMELHKMIARFCLAFNSFTEGARNSERLVQENHEAYQALRHTIRCTVPEVQFSHHSSMPKTGGFEVVDDEPLPEGSTLLCNPMSLLDIRTHIKRSITRELPNDVPSWSKFGLIDRFTTLWHDPAMKCVNRVYGQVIKVLMTLLSEHFGRFPSLRNHARTFVAEIAQSYRERTEDMINTLLSFELRPSTQNEYEYKKYREKFIAHYKALSTRTTSSNTSSSLPAGNLTAKPKSAFANTHQGWDGAQTMVSRQLWISPHASLEDQRQRFLLGTSLTPYCETTIHDRFSKVTEHYISITVMPAYKSFSVEELRVADYRRTRMLSAHGVNLSDSQTVNSDIPRIHRRNSGTGFQGSTDTDPQTESASDVHDPELLDTALAALQRLGLDVTAQDIEKLSVGDDFDAELTVAAEIRAFFQNTHRSIIHTVPKAIDNLFLFRLAEDMQSILSTKLELGNKEKDAGYLTENPKISVKRKELLGRQKLLERIKDKLLDFCP